MKDSQKNSLSNGENSANAISIDIPWDELPDTPYGTIGTIPFHDTQGQIEVNGGGQLQYILPIALPPGIKSVAPQINLMYTSGSGNGIAGYGFNLSGITSITRTGKTLEKDGEVKGIQLDYTDFYQFNGQRLILISGEYGKDGAEYTTEKYSNVKIKSVGVNDEGTGPFYFEVTFEDGSQAWYGDEPFYLRPIEEKSDGRTLIEYNIVKWKDAQGNYISYSYHQNFWRGDNITVIRSIGWGGNEVAGTYNFNSILFNYLDRELREVSYVNGKKFTQTNILSNIEVRVQEKLFKKYSIEYKKDDIGNKYQFVKSITESNAKGENAKPVTFNYQESKPGEWKSTWITNDTSKDILYGDFDGDGKIDVLKYMDAFNECVGGYESVYVEEDYGQSGYYQQECQLWEQRKAGLYLFGSIFDDNRPEQVHTGTLITKEQFRKAKAFNLKTLNGNILPRQGFITYNTLYPAGLGDKKDLEIKAYSIDPESKQLKEEFTKTIPGDAYDNSISRDFNANPYESQYWVETYIEDVHEMDLDGDGLSDLVFILRDTSYREINNTGPHGELQIPEIIIETRYRYLIVQPGETELQKLASTVYIGPYYDQEFFAKAKQGDFNGDGIVDFLYFDSGGRPYLTVFKKNSSGIFSVNNISYSDIIIEGLREKAITGDFTGDGKTDLMVPQAEGNETWKLYISTGKGFEVQTINNLARYNKDFTFKGDKHDRYINRQFFAQDLNKDGKADFIEFYSHIIDWSKSGKSINTKFIILYHENKGMDANGNIVFETKNIDGHWQNKKKSIFPYKQDWYPEQYGIMENNQSYDIYTEVQGYAFSSQPAHYSPIIGNFRVNNFNESILILQEGRLIKYSHYKVSDEARITSINQGGITTEIEYKELDPNINKDFYEKVKEDTHYSYPYLEMDKISGSYAVSQLRQEGKKQDFKYRGFVAHLQGKGMIGFRKAARSSWYADGYENTKIWNAAEIDPLNEGLPIKEWSVKTIDDNHLIFPEDLSVNNTQLLSLKSTEYEITAVSPGVKAIVPKKTVTKDFLKDITEESSVTYGDYYLPNETITKINNDAGLTSTVMVYTHNPNGTGKNYFIGRPQYKIKTVTAYGDIQSTKEEYSYENNMLKTLKMYNRDNSGWMQEKYSYDNFGNITEKTVSNSVDTIVQNQKSLYEPKGRFVIKKIDNLGLETTIEYNDWGQILTQTDPLGNVSTHTYDAWGKPETSKTNLGGMTTYTYEKLEDGSTKITEYALDGTPKEISTNKLGQQYRVRERGFNRTYIIDPDLETSVGDTYMCVHTLYDALGRKISETEPYLNNEQPKWNTISYDDSVFPPVVTATAFNGKAMKTSVSGRITTVEELNGNKRITRKTTDTLGNLVSSEDKGGIIYFSYNAAGEQLTAQYGSNIVTTRYDVWGRKSEFNDPSNGLYKYEYNGSGQIKKEISPGGYKEYFYNDKGQLINQTEKSNTLGLTDKNISISYNDKGLITGKTGTSNGKTYGTTVIYDIYGRLSESTETNNGKTYVQKDIIYDNLSRIASYEKGLTSGGIYTKVIIANIYDNWSGQLYQMKDKTTGNILWRLYESNGKGQVVRGRLGAADIINTYDVNNFLSQTEQRSDKGLLFGSQYTFDALKNELKERNRQGNFALNEIFTYDDNNRLVQWTNPKTGGISSNKYDLQGRITENDQVGTLQFDNAIKVYQPTGAKLNTIGKQNYLNAQIQRIIYNENNDPLYIHSKKGDVKFEYGLTGARQVVMLGQDLSTENSQPSMMKFYSEDGSFEVVRNTITGEEKHILYIGGTPYESNVVYCKDFTQNNGSYRFLHKDYLGSILAISDENGNLIQETHFDAWGQLTAGNINLLGRGYTSHEHFEEIGIIHMNGRLYDPLLRRFLNADPHIQEPFNTQVYNKYAYVINNPLIYNDPNGELFWLAILAGALIGAITGAAHYIGVAIQTGNFNIGGFFKSILGGAVTGAILGAIAPMAIPTGTIGGFALAGFLGSFMPSVNINLGGGFSFSVSLSVAFGNSMGLGANFALSYNKGSWNFSAGIGISKTSNTGNTGLSFWEKRYSGSIGYDDGKFGFSLYSTTFRGGGLNQRIGGLMIRQGDFSARYENDGWPFDKRLFGLGFKRVLGDGNDSNRTAALHVGYQQFGIGFNLFTGKRFASSYAESKGHDAQEMKYTKENGSRIGSFGERYPHGYVEEIGPQYRMGALYMSIGAMRTGQDSDYFRHSIQDLGAHTVSKQPGFQMMSNDYRSYIQFQIQNPFTLW